MKGESCLVKVYCHDPLEVIVKRAIFNQQIWYKNLLSRSNVLTGKMLTNLTFKYFTNMLETIINAYNPSLQRCSTRMVEKKCYQQQFDF